MIPEASHSCNERFDLILHVGVGSSNGIRIEARARRFGYDLRDVDDALAPSVQSSHLGFLPTLSTVSSTPARPLKPCTQSWFGHLCIGLSADVLSVDAGIIPKPIGFVALRSDVAPPRGIGEGYEGCPYEIWNSTINVEKLVEAVQEKGVQVGGSFDPRLFWHQMLMMMAHYSASAH